MTINEFLDKWEAMFTPEAREVVGADLASVASQARAAAVAQAAALISDHALAIECLPHEDEIEGLSAKQNKAIQDAIDDAMRETCEVIARNVLDLAPAPPGFVCVPVAARDVLIEAAQSLLDENAATYESFPGNREPFPDSPQDAILRAAIEACR